MTSHTTKKAGSSGLGLAELFQDSADIQDAPIKKKTRGILRPKATEAPVPEIDPQDAVEIAKEISTMRLDGHEMEEEDDWSSLRADKINRRIGRMGKDLIEDRYAPLVPPRAPIPPPALVQAPAVQAPVPIVEAPVPVVQAPVVQAPVPVVQAVAAAAEPRPISKRRRIRRGLRAVGISREMQDENPAYEKWFHKNEEALELENFKRVVSREARRMRAVSTVLNMVDTYADKAAAIENHAPQLIQNRVDYEGRLQATREMSKLFNKTHVRENVMALANLLTPDNEIRQHFIPQPAANRAVDEDDESEDAMEE